MTPKQLELIDKQETEIDRVPAKDIPEEDGPELSTKLDLSEDEIDRLKQEVFKHWDALKEERIADGRESKWENLQAQYDGEMRAASYMEFNLDTGVTMIKVDSLARLATRSFLETDPKFTITARPETARMDKWEVVVQRQSDYLDYKLDEVIDIRNPLRQVIHQACLFDVGIMKITYEYIRKRRIRKEFFSGKVIQKPDGSIYHEGLESFLKEYPTATEPNNEGFWAYQRLLEGRDVWFKANFFQTVYDDPKPTFVDIKDFWCPLGTEGYDGLSDCQITVERQKYSWWELKHRESDGDFINVEEMKNQAGGEGEDKVVIPNHELKKDYEVIEVVYWFNKRNNKKVEDEERIVCWFGVEGKIFLGAISYPYDLVDSYYIPFSVTKKKPGFYQKGIAEDITDSHLVQNAVINFMLTEAWQQLVTTPIVYEGSTIADQFLSGRWKPGIPIEISQVAATLDTQLDFLEKPQRQVASQLLPVLLYLAKQTDDKTGISSLMSGKETPTDPQAPASKTAMLLKQSGINVEDYIDCLAPSFNKVGEIILALTYQMSHGGRELRLSGQVVGGNPFESITKDQMIAKTNIQTRASSFAFDKIREKQENLALYQMMRTDPIVVQNPDAVFQLARTLVSSWSPLWKNKVDQILPSPEEFAQGQIKLAVQALGIYLQTLQAKSKVTGVAAQPQFQEYVQTVSQLLQQAVTPTPQEPANV